MIYGNNFKCLWFNSSFFILPTRFGHHDLHRDKENSEVLKTVKLHVGHIMLLL